MNEAKSYSWARTYDAIHDATVYRRFQGIIPERARFCVIHPRDLPAGVAEFCAAKNLDCVVVKHSISGTAVKPEDISLP